MSFFLSADDFVVDAVHVMQVVCYRGIFVTNYVNWKLLQKLCVTTAWQCFYHKSFFLAVMQVLSALWPVLYFQSGQFWATSIASFRERCNDSRSCWVVFIHVVRGHPGGLLQFSKGEAVKICLASDSSGIHTMWPNRKRRRAWTVAERCDCSVFRLTSLFCTWRYHLIPNSLCTYLWLRASIIILFYNCFSALFLYVAAWSACCGW